MWTIMTGEEELRKVARKEAKKVARKGMQTQCE